MNLAVAIANGRMRSLKVNAPSTDAREIVGCNSEWPYEVTERQSGHPPTRRFWQVAIANGRMRSLKAQLRQPENCERYVAIANGRMRSLKVKELKAIRCTQMVAIANGRMRSLKVMSALAADQHLTRCNSEWPYEVTESSCAASSAARASASCNSEWPYEVTETSSGRQLISSWAMLQ